MKGSPQSDFEKVMKGLIEDSRNYVLKLLE
jgi:hypothetical protein